MKNYDELPTFGYRSDSRLAAIAPYGTYPGKRGLRSTNTVAPVASAAAADEVKKALLQSTTNAYETHWQPPANPVMLLIPQNSQLGGELGADLSVNSGAHIACKKISASCCETTSTPLSQRRRSSRSNSPQRGILRRRGSPVASVVQRPNLFDCPSASNLTILGRNAGVHEKIQHNNCMPHKLRNESQKIKTNSEEKDDRKSRRCYKYYADVMRMMAVEFIALTITIFFHFHTRFMLNELKVLSGGGAAVVSKAEVGVLPFVDAATATAIFAALPTVHLNPLITVAHMFSSFLPFVVCVAIICAQMCACFFSGALLFLYLNYDTQHTIEVPIITPSVVGGNYARDAYQLVFGQFAGTLLLVVCHLAASRQRWRPNLRLRTNKFDAALLGIFGSVWLSAYFSLARSTVSWNVAFSCVSAGLHFFLKFARDADFWPNFAALKNNYIFWMGPTIGALFACFLYRLALPAETDERKTEETRRCC